MGIKSYIRTHANAISVPGQTEPLYAFSQVEHLLQPFFNETDLRTFLELCTGFPNESPLTLLEETFLEDVD